MQDIPSDRNMKSKKHMQYCLFSFEILSLMLIKLSIITYYLNPFFPPTDQLDILIIRIPKVLVSRTYKADDTYQNTWFRDANFAITTNIMEF